MHLLSSMATNLVNSTPLRGFYTKLRATGKRGQSFVELALVLPVLIIMLAGMTEVAFFVGRYLDALDLTREAARFASVRLYTATLPSAQYDCSNANAFDFYYDTSCIFSPPANSPSCVSAQFCNGFNPYLTMDLAHDDIVITAFTTDYNQADGKIEVAPNGVHPANGWAFSTNTGNGTDNWKYDCQGNVVTSTPYYTAARVNATLLQSADITTNKGFVAVEFYYCYHQVLNLPIISNIVPNPARIHVYTVMPLPSAQPTPTPQS